MNFEYLLKNYYESNKSSKFIKISKHKNPNKCNICNKCDLFKQLFATDFILKLSYGDIDDNFINNFIKSSFKYVVSNRNITNDRTCNKNFKTLI